MGERGNPELDISLQDFEKYLIHLNNIHLNSDPKRVYTFTRFDDYDLAVEKGLIPEGYKDLNQVLFNGENEMVRTREGVYRRIKVSERYECAYKLAYRLTLTLKNYGL